MASPIAERSLQGAGVAAAIALPGSLLAGALISQYGFGLYPCEMCHWQRWPHWAALAIGLIALLLHRNGKGGIVRALIVLAAFCVAASGLIGGFHAGVEYGWWEGLSSCSTTPFANGGDPLEAIMNAPTIRCDVAQWKLWGVSLAGFNFLFSIAGAGLMLALALRRPADAGAVSGDSLA